MTTEYEKALSELVDKITGGLDTGDLLIDAKTASAMLGQGHATVHPAPEAQIAAAPNVATPLVAQPAPVQEPVIKQGWDVDTLLDKPAAQPAPVAQEELTDSQIMASAGRCSAGISESQPIGQQWDLVCELVRHVMRERGYTAPPAAQRQWVGLTDDEADECVDIADEAHLSNSLLFWSEHHIKAIEAKLKEKNT